MRRAVLAIGANFITINLQDQLSAFDPTTGTWDKYVIPVGVPNAGSITYFTDFDTLGTDEHGVYFGMRIFGSNGSDRAKIAATGKASLIGRTVSAVFADCFYIREPPRQTGIRVNKPASGLSIGSVIDVAGTVQTTSSGERFIAPSLVVP